MKLNKCPPQIPYILHKKSAFLLQFNWSITTLKWNLRPLRENFEYFLNPHTSANQTVNDNVTEDWPRLAAGLHVVTATATAVTPKHTHEQLRLPLYKYILVCRCEAIKSGCCCMLWLFACLFCCCFDACCSLVDFWGNVFELKRISFAFLSWLFCFCDFCYCLYFAPSCCLALLEQIILAAQPFSLEFSFTFTYFLLFGFDLYKFLAIRTPNPFFHYTSLLVKLFLLCCFCYYGYLRPAYVNDGH